MLGGIQGHLDQVLLAIPSLPRSERRIIVAELQRHAMPVLQIPSLDDLTSGRARIDALRPFASEDLLGQKGFQGATSFPWGMGRSAASAAFRPRVWWLWWLRPAAL